MKLSVDGVNGVKRKEKRENDTQTLFSTQKRIGHKGRKFNELVWFSSFRCCLQCALLFAMEEDYSGGITSHELY